MRAELAIFILHEELLMRTAISLAAFVLAAIVPAARCLAEAPAAEPSAKAGRPNFVFILVDDLRHDAMSCAGNPFMKTPQIDRIAAGGVRFANAFVTTSLCSPARASFLTGMYANAHGVRTNENEELDPKWPTFPGELKKHGYESAFVGKWHMGMNDAPRPGFDYWLSFPGQGVYPDPKLNENGRQFQAKGYMTDILTDYAVAYLKKARSKPFCLYFSHKAVHADFMPAERHKGLFMDFSYPEPANYKDDYANKPQWQRVMRIRGGRLIKPAPETLPASIEIKPWDEEQARLKRRLDYYRTLAAVDESVGRVLDTLRDTGQLDNTVIIFAGDNGFFHGEHNGLSDKRLAYEESMRIPMLAAGPGIPKGKVRDEMVLNIDVAPTFLAYAGVPIPASVQGASLEPLFADGSAPWRDAFLYEYFRENWLPGIPDMLGVRTKDMKYVTYPGLSDIDELYDLRKDSLELHNLAVDSNAAAELARMRAELAKLCKQTGRPL